MLFQQAVRQYDVESQSISNRFSEGRLTSFQTPRYLEPFKNPPEIMAESGVLSAALTLNYADFQLWNPVLKRQIELRLRSYNSQLVGPTMRIRPGGLLRIKLQNKFPSEPHEHGGHDRIRPPGLTGRGADALGPRRVLLGGRDPPGRVLAKWVEVTDVPLWWLLNEEER
jgi:hypothetical protein